MSLLRKPPFIVFSVLIFLNFFGMFQISNTILIVTLIPFVLWGIGNEKLCFRRVLLFLLISLIFDMVSCYIYQGQDFWDSIKAMAFFYYIFFYFIICYLSPSVNSLVTSITWLSLIFNTLYILQFYLLQRGITFLPVDETSIYLGEGARFHMIGSGLASLSIFLGVNQFLSHKRKLYLLLSISGIFVLLLMAFRTMVVLSLLFVVLELFLVKGVKKSTFVYFILFGVLLLVTLQIPVVADKIEYMWEKQFGQGTEHSFSNKEYIRWVTLAYYYNDHFHDSLEMFLGSGYPVVNGSYYKNIETSLWSIGIFWMDWGILGLSWMIGIPAVLSMLYYSFKVYKIKSDKAFFFLPIWFLYMILSSITTAEFFRQGNFIIQALCLYLAERTYKENLKVK